MYGVAGALVTSTNFGMRSMRWLWLLGCVGMHSIRVFINTASVGNFAGTWVDLLLWLVLYVAYLASTVAIANYRFVVLIDTHGVETAHPFTRWASKGLVWVAKNALNIYTGHLIVLFALATVTLAGHIPWIAVNQR